MGNQQCRQCQQLKQHNAAYGQYQVYRQDNRQYVLVEKKLEKQKGLALQIDQELAKRKQIKNKHIVKLEKYEVRESEYDIKISLHYEYLPKTLKDYISDLNFREDAISEKQLFDIIYGVQSGLEALSQQNIMHGCINLQTILCKNNIFKITDISSTTYLTSYELTMRGNRQQFLSQKLLNNLSFKKFDLHDTDIHDDLFSLGLIVLMIVAKGKPQNFYEWKQDDKYLLALLNQKYITNCFKILNRNYSKKLCNKVSSFVYSKRQSKDQGDTTHLTEQLQQLQFNMSRVLKKIKNSTSKGSSLKGSIFSTPLQFEKI